MAVTNADKTAWPLLETLQSSLIGLIAFTAAIAPLGVPTLLVVLVMITLAQDLGDGVLTAEGAWHYTSDRATLMTLAFVFYCFISSLWALRPLYSFISLAQNTLVGLGGWYVAWSLVRRLRTIGPVRVARYTRALPLSFIFVGLYFLLDGLTGESATLFFVRNAPWIFDGFENSIRYTKEGVAIGLHDIYFNRTAAALVMMVPGLAAAFAFWPHARFGHGLALIAAVTMLAVCLKSNSATALLALIAGLAFFAFALWSRHVTVRILQIAFLVATLGAVPLSMLPKHFGFDTSPKIPFSFRERVVIWDDLARLTMETPIVGIGAKSIKFWPGLPTNDPTNKRPAVRTYWHPHNGYLQIWLELGAIGAVLFALAGTMLLGRLGSLERLMQPYAIGLAAATLILIGPGWGLWQPWLIAAIAFGWLTLLMVRPEFEASVQSGD